MARDGIFQIALFGAGRIGRVHAGNIARHPRSALAAVVDPLNGPAEAAYRSLETGRTVELSPTLEAIP